MTIPDPARYSVRQTETGYRILDEFHQSFVLSAGRGGLTLTCYRTKAEAIRACGELNRAYIASAARPETELSARE